MSEREPRGSGRVYLKAAIAVVDVFRDRELEGKFSRFSIASLDYLSQVTEGKKLGGEEKQLLMLVLALGVKINDFYDEGVLRSGVYKKLRREFWEIAPDRQKDFSRYRRELSLLEKKRPDPQSLINDGKRLSLIESYRKAVNRLSLAFCCSIAFDKPLADAFPWFESFFNCVMAAQVVDDLVGRAGDVLHNRPSFYTAVCFPHEISEGKVEFGQETKKKLSGLFMKYYQQSHKTAPNYMRPIINAVFLIRKTYPFLIEAVRRPPLEKLAFKVMSRRDREDL